MSQSMAERYGRPRRRIPRAAWIGLATAVLAGAGVGAALLAQNYADRLRGEMLSYRVLDDRNVEITWAVHRRDSDDAIECALRARNRAGAEVARTPLVIPSGGPRRITGTTTIDSSERAVTGEIKDCAALETSRGQ
ncbi:MAG: DUF4307 domain-containing protein [Sporichthyaceae bacterium]